MFAREAAKFLGMGTSNLYYLRAKQRGPKCFRIGASFAYLVSDLELWRHAHPGKRKAKRNTKKSAVATPAWFMRAQCEMREKGKRELLHGRRAWMDAVRLVPRENTYGRA